MSQVIMNLITNASEAIGDERGEVTLSTGLLSVDTEYLKDAWLSAEVPEGVYVYLRVADTGCGMDAAALARIFDPFLHHQVRWTWLRVGSSVGDSEESPRHCSSCQ